MKDYEKLRKFMFKNILHNVHDSTGHGVHNILSTISSLKSFNSPSFFKISPILLESMTKFHN